MSKVIEVTIDQECVLATSKIGLIVNGEVKGKATYATVCREAAAALGIERPKRKSESAAAPVVPAASPEQVNAEIAAAAKKKGK